MSSRFSRRGEATRVHWMHDSSECSIIIKKYIDGNGKYSQRWVSLRCEQTKGQVRCLSVGVRTLYVYVCSTCLDKDTSLNSNSAVCLFLYHFHGNKHKINQKQTKKNTILLKNDERISSCLPMGFPSDNLYFASCLNVSSHYGGSQYIIYHWLSSS